MSPYSEIERDGTGRIVALHPIDPSRVRPHTGANGMMQYGVKQNDGREELFGYADILDLTALVPQAVT